MACIILIMATINIPSFINLAYILLEIWLRTQIANGQTDGSTHIELLWWLVNYVAEHTMCLSNIMWLLKCTNIWTLLSLMSNLFVWLKIIEWLNNYVAEHKICVYKRAVNKKYVINYSQYLIIKHVHRYHQGIIKGEY